MIIYVGGVSGTGKTLLIKQTLDRLEKEGIKIELTRGLELLCKLVGVKTVEELRFVPEETKAKFRPQMYKQMYKIDRKDITTIRISDGHFCFFDQKTKQYIPRETRPEEKEQILFFLVIVADEKDILERRKRDKIIRPDRSLNIDLIEEEQKLELKTAFKQSNELLVPIEIIENREGKMNDAVNKFVDLINKYRPRI